MHYDGRDLYQGSLTYYFELIFLLLTKFDPVNATYLFMCVGVLMVIPLFYGVKMLINKSAGFAAAIIYILTPLYINYTRSLWNPCFQFVWTPLLIFLIGLHNQSKKNFILLFIGITGGLCLLFHYQYIVILAGVIVYYFFVNKQSWKGISLLLGGMGIGFSPMILFELRNNFYNIRTAIFFVQKFSEQNNASPREIINVHYFVSISLVALPIVLWYVRNYLTKRVLFLLYFILMLIALYTYGPRPQQAAGMAPEWNVRMEEKAYGYIRTSGVKDFNVVNLGYDTVATVQKFFLKRDGISIDFENYYTNNHLFVITDKKDFMKTDTYEISTFKPSKLVKTWKINDRYSLYLMKRLPKEGSLTNE